MFTGIGNVVFRSKLSSGDGVGIGRRGLVGGNAGGMRALMSVYNGIGRAARVSVTIGVSGMSFCGRWTTGSSRLAHVLTAVDIKLICISTEQIFNKKRTVHGTLPSQLPIV